MESTKQLRKELDELKERFNQLILILEGVGLKQKVNFDYLEIDLDEEEEEDKEEEEEIEIPKPEDFSKEEETNLL